MKAFLSSVVVAVVIAVSASFVLNDGFQETATEAFTREGVRLSATEPNLVEF